MAVRESELHICHIKEVALISPQFYEQIHLKIKNKRNSEYVLRPDFINSIKMLN